MLKNDLVLKIAKNEGCNKHLTQALVLSPGSQPWFSADVRLHACAKDSHNWLLSLVLLTCSYLLVC